MRRVLLTRSYGPELVIGGDFSDPSLVTPSSAEATVADGVGRFTALTANRTLTLNLRKALTVGRRYEIGFGIAARTAGSARITTGGTNGANQSTVERWSQVITATLANTTIVVTGVSGATLDVDHVTVREIL